MEPGVHGMRVEVSAGSIDEDEINAYAHIPIRFEVTEVFDVMTSGHGDTRFELSLRKLGVSYLKDYDAIGEEDPASWAKRFDVSKWGFLAARDDGQRVGGAVVILEGQSDLAVLWDIRVAPSARGRGVGSALFAAAEAWASARECRQLKVETQNINVAACRLYSRHGCVLRAARPGAYPQFPDEVQLLWYKDLDRQPTTG
jgi:ribosomal protein S18 acetylase RimI-like enzyme